eukprot:scaffold100721_cov69-Phaeocystis_antarctica.AAC.3
MNTCTTAKSWYTRAPHSSSCVAPSGDLVMPSRHDSRQASGGPPDLAQRKPRLEVPVSSEF